MQQATHPDIEELDRPRTIADLAEYLRGRGEKISRGTIYSYIKAGHLPVARVGRLTTTARCFYEARMPRSTGAGQ